MKKRISLALAAVFAYVLSSCSLFGNSGLKDYKNEVDEDEFYDEGEELLDDLGYLDDDAFECDFEISYSEKFEEKSVKVYDGSSKKYESTETEESTATYTYDDDNKVIHGKMTEKENSKSPSGKSTYSSSEEMYMQEDGKDLVSVDVNAGTYTSLGSMIDIEYYASMIVKQYLQEPEGEEYYVDGNVFTAVTEDKDSSRQSHVEYESESLEIEQMIIEEGSITFIYVEESTLISEYEDYTITSTSTYVEKTVISLKDAKVNEVDLSDYTELSIL